MKIAILAAMDKEMALLKNILNDAENVVIDNIKAFKGRINHHEVLLSKCGIGKVNAALNTLRIIREFNPDLVINSGVAGGAGGLKIGDLLIAGKVGYHDVWCGPGTVPGTADGFDRIFVPYQKTIEIAKKYLGNEDKGGISYGLIATGDIFVSKKEEIESIHNVFPEAVAVDMESAAIAHTCASENIPFNIIRVVSDTPGEAENISQYKNFWSEAPEKTFQALEVILPHL
ncbi:MAG: 5'-methylthioadenosine/adenosylhomocysteine nucleosidase [Muribaculaceae bacterium]|nr:5'-methylthioadenosine/adenosylhomocysteine nucleosidase [Muribaculaceae bacterium]